MDTNVPMTKVAGAGKRRFFSMDQIRRAPFFRFPLAAFTLIELMLVVAIIGLLAAIALPKFANLVIKAKEASIRGKLGAIRSALSIYYADNEGRNISTAGGGEPNLSLTTGGKYLAEMPSISIPTQPNIHPNVNGTYGSNFFGSADGMYGTGYRMAWYYHDPTGSIIVNCSHTDSKGTTWSQW